MNEHGPFRESSHTKLSDQREPSPVEENDSDSWLSDTQTYPAGTFGDDPSDLIDATSAIALDHAPQTLESRHADEMVVDQGQAPSPSTSDTSNFTPISTPAPSQSITKPRRARKQLARVRAYEKGKQRHLEHRRRIYKSIAPEKITYKLAYWHSRRQKRANRESAMITEAVETFLLLRQQEKKQAAQAKKKIIMRASVVTAAALATAFGVRCCWRSRLEQEGP